MEMVILLLVSAVAQLVTPVPTPTANINAQPKLQILGAINDFETTFKKDFFVEDVQELVDAGCKNNFFCKVRNILLAHKKVGETKDETKLVRHLNAYISSSNIDCKEELLSVKNSTVTKPITDLLENIKKCSQRKTCLGATNFSTRDLCCGGTASLVQMCRTRFICNFPKVEIVHVGERKRKTRHN